MLLPFFKSVKLQKGGAWSIEDAKPVATVDLDPIIPSPQIYNNRGVAISPDGLRLFTTAGGDDTFIVEMPLSTAGDTTSVRVATQQIAIPYLARFLSFSQDGTSLYVTSAAWDEGLFQYTLSTPWDISTMTLAHQMQTPGEIIFDMFAISPNGTKIFCSTNNTTKSYTLSTPWNISTASLSHTTTQSDHLRSGIFSTDGKSIIYLHYDNNKIGLKQAKLTTPYDTTTLSINDKRVEIAESVTGEGMCASPSGRTLYVANTNQLSITQIELGRNDWATPPTSPKLVLATAPHTEATSPTGEAIALSVYPPDPDPAWLAFDGDPSGDWWASDESDIPGWIGYHFNTPQKIVALRYDPRESLRAPRQFKIQISQDGEDWQDVYQDLEAPKVGYDIGTDSGLIPLSIPSPIYYIRIYIEETWIQIEGGGAGSLEWCVMGEIYLYKEEDE